MTLKNVYGSYHKVNKTANLTLFKEIVTIYLKKSDSTSYIKYLSSMAELTKVYSY